METHWPVGGGPPDKSLKGKVLGGDKKDTGTVQPQPLLSSVGNCSSPPPPSESSARAGCLPEFQEGRDLVPREVEGWHPGIRLPSLLVPWGGKAGRREKDSPSANQ